MAPTHPLLDPSLEAMLNRRDNLQILARGRVQEPMDNRGIYGVLSKRTYVIGENNYT